MSVRVQKLSIHRDGQWALVLSLDGQQRRNGDISWGIFDTAHMLSQNYPHLHLKIVTSHGPSPSVGSRTEGRCDSYYFDSVLPCYDWRVLVLFVLFYFHDEVFVFFCKWVSGGTMLIAITRYLRLFLTPFDCNPTVQIYLSVPIVQPYYLFI